MNEKTLMIIGTIGGIIPILPIITWFIGGNNLQGNNRETLRTMANAEILLFIAGFILGFIPLINMIAAPVILIANIIFIIKSYNCIDKEAFTLPIPEIIK